MYSYALSQQQWQSDRVWIDQIGMKLSLPRTIKQNLAQKMKAVVVDHYIDKVSEVSTLIKEFPDPKPAKDEALVEVKYCALNFFDILQMQGKYQTQPPLPHVAGHEFTGVVKSSPPGASLKVGTRVCGMYQGGFAQKVVVPWQQLIAVPDNMSWEDAAGELDIFLCENLRFNFVKGIYVT